MSKAILVGVQKAIEKIQNSDILTHVVWGHKKEWEIDYYSQGIWMAYHYGTFIGTVFYNKKTMKPELSLEHSGAYSASDRDVINSMCNYFGTDTKVSIKGGYLHTIPREN